MKGDASKPIRESQAGLGALSAGQVDALPEEEARYHLKRCEDSGLWVPNAEARF